MAQSSTPVPGVIGQDSKNRTITTAVPFLTITPDARAAALGDAGVATSADVNAAYWNSAKLAFTEDKAGIGLSYTPWLAKIINDMYIFYLSGYYKIDREQTIGVSMKYFDMGVVNLRDANNQETGYQNPRDFAIDVTYSRLLSENLSIGGAIRFIHSNLIGANAGFDTRPGKSVAVDMGIYYNKPLVNETSTLSLGASITNVGAKMSYSNADVKDFIPGNLRLGGAYQIEVGPSNSFTFIMDFNKLLVPSPKADHSQRDKSLLSGVFGSFGDAPGGFSEEIREIMLSSGVEYWYNKTFAGRLGYFNEAYDKGNRKYITSGVGFKKDLFGLDVAYMVPINKRENALAETIRFSLVFTPRFKGNQAVEETP